jgi:nucleoside-diphosphate-sugar epimerase
METVAVTGGNGTIGSRLLAHLAEHGYRTADLARGSRRETVSDRYLRTDLLDPGDVYGSLAAVAPDAIVHVGTIPAPGSNPGHTVFESNVMSSYYVLEAAAALGIDRVALASSINVVGSVYQAAPMDVRYLPVDEAHPVTPRDPYAMGKHAMEVTADGFGRRPDGPTTIASLRYPLVATDTQLREAFVDADRTYGTEATRTPPGHREELFTYVHIDDGVAAARRAIEADYEGHEAFWITAADTTLTTPTAEVVPEAYPDADVRASFDGTDGIVDCGKAERLLGWTPARRWRELD